MSTWLTRAHSILGMNARNLAFIRPYNPSRAIKTANNKLATKEKLLAADLPTAKLYGVIRTRKELFQFNWENLPSNVVVKPNFGLGGGGIVVLYGKDKQGRWISTGEETYGAADLVRHCSNILDGNYSLSNIPDIVYFEERLRLSEEFKNVSYQGVPDVRIIVFNSVPVMAMLRLPTKASQGKANLHIGGIGVGIDLTTGVTTYAVSKDQGEILMHPDFDTPLHGIQIRDWDTVLLIAIKATRAIGLGYAGVDIVLDKETGPMILEVNGHPGLEIQNANRLSLRDRLKRVAGLSITSANQGLNVCKQLFGSPDTMADANPYGVLGVFETVSVFTKAGEEMQLRTLVDTGLASTTITSQLAKKLGFGEAITALAQLNIPSTVTAERAQAVEETFRTNITNLHADWADVVAVRSSGQYIIRPKLILTLTIGGQRRSTEVAVALDDKLSYPMIIGRRDLAGFYIDPTRGMM